MGSTESIKWKFRGSEEVVKASACTIRSTLTTLREHIESGSDVQKVVIPLGHGDPSGFPSFRTTMVAEDAIVDALRSAKYNSYALGVGLPQARRSIAEYLSHNHPNEVSSENVFVTVGAKHAIQVIITVLSHPGANILLPRPGYPLYKALATFNNLEIRHFDLLPEHGWEVNLDDLEALVDDKTIAMVLINPGNPCGNVYSYEHLKKVAETARKLGILVIADEAYGYLTFGSKPFVPFGGFGSIVPVLTIGSISKRWLVLGWRLGWIVANDPNCILQKHKVIQCIKSYLDLSPDAATFTQAAVSQILKQTPNEFYSKTINKLKEAANICYEGLKEIPCLSCPCKPEGSMFLMAKLNLSILDNIIDDMEFCIKLAREESVIVLPGVTLGLEGWIHITFAAEISALREGLRRIKAFSLRHSRTG